MALRLTQPLTEMSTRNISWGGKGGRCVGLTTLSPSSADCLEPGSPSFLEPSGLVQACNGIALPLPLPCIRGCEWSVSFPGRFIPVERALGTCWIGEWVDRALKVTPSKEEGSVACVGNRTAVGQAIA